MFILGVDSHTALVLDLDAGTASVSGLGAATVRVAGRSTRFPSGTDVPIETLAEVAGGLASGSSAAGDWVPSAAAGRRPGGQARRAAPLRDAVAQLEGSFVEALDRGATRDAVGALLDLDSAIAARVRAGEDSPDLDNASATFRSLIARLGERAEAAARDPGPLLDPLVAALLEVRARARASRDWATADLVRDRLAAAGIEVRDGAEGSTWGPSGGSPG